MNSERLWIGVVLAVAVGGCAVGPNYRTPETRVPGEWSGLKSGVSTTQPTSGPTTRSAKLATWWEWLNDPTLDSLMTRAVESNLDLRVATARVREARAQCDVATAAFWPQVNVGGSYTYSGSSLNTGPKPASSGGPLSRLFPTISASPGTFGGSPSLTATPQRTTLGGSKGPTVSFQPGSIGVPAGRLPSSVTINPPGSQTTAQVSRQQNLFRAGFDATWELDLFGGVRRSIEAAHADLAAFEETRCDVLVTLISEVGLNYVQLRGSQRRLTIANENIAAQRDTLELTRSRYAAGFVSELDVVQSQALLATTQSQVPLLESAIRQPIYQLSVLIGQPPGELVAELEKEEPIPAIPPEVPMGLPSDLLRRRPDVRTAERQLAAATARIGQAVADLFPKFSLTGSFGPQTRDINRLFDNKSLAWSVGPAVTWPIFDAGAIRANIEVQNARQEEALGTYEKAVLTAFQDVEVALVAYTTERVRRQVLAEAVAANQQATDLSNELYGGGLIAFLNVLVSEQALYVSQDQLIQSETTAVTNLISLYKALGGGWDSEPGTE